MNHQKSNRHLKKILIKAFVIGIISLFLLEIAMRGYNHLKPSYIFYDDSYNRFRGRPHARDWEFRLNAGGFKDLAFTEKQSGTFRILGLGDSFAFGMVPYAFNYLTLLEDQLNRNHEQKVEVLNMGIPSTGPQDYLSILMREGLPTKPDLVLLSFYIGNDFKDCESLESRPIHSYSYVASFIHYVFRIQPKFEGTVPHPHTEYCDTCPGLEYEKYMSILRDRSFIYREGNECFLNLFDEACACLVKMRDICRKKEIPFLVVMIPDEFQVNPELRRKFHKVFNPPMREDPLDLTYPNRLLADRLRLSGIDYLDLTGPFMEASKKNRLYRIWDTHWNIAGNRLAAGIIHDFILSHLPDEQAGQAE